jgi:hypothetical protein
MEVVLLPERRAFGQWCLEVRLGVAAVREPRQVYRHAEVEHNYPEQRERVPDDRVALDRRDVRLAEGYVVRVLVVLVMRVLPRPVGNEQRRVQHEPDGVVLPLRRAKGAMAALVRQHPEAPRRGSLHDAINRQQDVVRDMRARQMRQVPAPTGRSPAQVGAQHARHSTAHILHGERAAEHALWETHGQRQTGQPPDRRTGRQAGGQAGGQAGRQADGRADKRKNTHTAMRG